MARSQRDAGTVTPSAQTWYVRIFLSSLISGFESFRDAAARGIRTLGHDVVRVEDFPARAATPQAACLAGVRDADVFVLVVGERYGLAQESGRSATHEEFLEARDRMPVLVFVQDGVSRDEEQQRFLEDVRGWSSGGLYKTFRTADELLEAVVRALHELELAAVSGPVDSAAVAAHAKGNLPEDRSRGSFGGEAQLVVSIAGGPRQQVLRPVELEAQDLVRSVQREAMFGESAVLDPDAATKHQIQGSRLLIAQTSRQVSLDEDGSVVVTQPATTAGPRRISALVDESIVSMVERALRFAGWLLDEIDPVRRVTDVAVATRLLGAGHTPWMTGDELERSGGSYTMGAGDDDATVMLTPPTQPRQALLFEPARLAEDITVLLRRSRRR